MLRYLESEVHELREEILDIKSNAVHNAAKEESVSVTNAMVSELGDIIFDVLMLEMILRR